MTKHEEELKNEIEKEEGYLNNYEVGSESWFIICSDIGKLQAELKGYQQGYKDCFEEECDKISDNQDIWNEGYDAGKNKVKKDFEEMIDDMLIYPRDKDEGVASWNDALKELKAKLKGEGQ